MASPYEFVSRRDEILLIRHWYRALAGDEMHDLSRNLPRLMRLRLSARNKLYSSDRLRRLLWRRTDSCDPLTDTLGP
jgi:hypothetical protein